MLPRRMKRRLPLADKGVVDEEVVVEGVSLVGAIDELSCSLAAAKPLILPTSAIKQKRKVY